MLISQSNVRAGGLLFPHPACIKQGNKRAVNPPTLMLHLVTAGAAHVEGERSAAWRHFHFFQAVQ